MENITNYIHNVGKPVKERKYDLRLTFDELDALVALAASEHNRSITDVQNAAQDFFHVGSRIIDSELRR